MFKTLANAWKLPELRKKLMFTLIILLIYRVIAAIPVPFVDLAVMEANNDYLNLFNNSILGLFDAMSGSAFSQASILALGIQPYINASIIIQLLTVAIPALERLAKDGGEEGKKKIDRITRLTTVGLGLLLGFAYWTMINNYGIMVTDVSKWITGIVVIGTFAAGSALVMWLGEQITANGIGNGISMILFANILAGLPNMFISLAQKMGWWATIVYAVLLVLVVFVVFINDAERRIPIQYAKRVVGRKVYGGQSTNLPIKVAMSGVMPVIFAQSIASVPATICAFAGITEESGKWWFNTFFSSNSWVYAGFYFLLIFFFSWFYSTIQYDPVEIGNNLKKNGGFIPGFRPGRPTSDFIKKVINKILIFGAIYLSVIALLPIISGILVPDVRNLAIGGTSIIIVVGVALETVKALEAQMLMRHYKGFLD